MRLIRQASNAIRERFAPWIVLDDNGTNRAEWTKGQARAWMPYLANGRIVNAYTWEAL